MNNATVAKKPMYDEVFFTYTDRMAIRSARRILPILQQFLEIHSVADFGCGNGGWLAVWDSLGVEDCVGIDGEYVDRERLLFDRAHFVAGDLSSDLALGRRFDLVQSLEVAEHLPAASARTLVKNLVTHSNIVLFSAAAPGQGGMNHINERPYGYWRSLFAEHDYEIFDIVRPLITNCADVECWYRYNTFVYAHREMVESLPVIVLDRKISSDQPVSDVSPWSYRVRKRLLRLLPVPVINWLSRCNTLWTRMRVKKGD